MVSGKNTPKLMKGFSKQFVCLENNEVICIHHVLYVSELLKKKNVYGEHFMYSVECSDSLLELW